MKKNLLFLLSLVVLLATPLHFLQAEASKEKDKKAPKCEKCYRGPDGKIKCDPVPCPEKK